LNYQNNYAGNLSIMSNTPESFNILVTSLSVILMISTKLFLDLCLVKFLD